MTLAQTAGNVPAVLLSGKEREDDAMPDSNAKRVSMPRTASMSMLVSMPQSVLVPKSGLMPRDWGQFQEVGHGK